VAALLSSFGADKRKTGKTIPSVPPAPGNKKNTGTNDTFVGINVSYPISFQAVTLPLHRVSQYRERWPW
jgi:hypothetical protein